jgi:DNA-binding IscR family transcriptional regulator
MADVLRVLEGDPSSSKPSGHRSPREEAIDAFLERCNAAVDHVSEHTSLSDLLEDAGRRRGTELEYQI